MDEPSRQARWRLVMGAGAEQWCGGLSGEDQAREGADTSGDPLRLANRKAPDSVTAPVVKRRRRY